MTGKEATPTSIPAEPLDGDNPLALAAYNQNFENFRALNALMWQIPLIAMTLTGGLWFGVANIQDMPLMRVGLLLLAAVGDFGLIIVLARLRYIISRYLAWTREAYPRGHVAAPGVNRRTAPETVKKTFQFMLLFAAIISFVLACTAMPSIVSSPAKSVKHAAAVSWYDEHAARLADGYEGLAAEDAHPRLFALLSSGKPLRILDAGAGTGRDASALAALGHQVTAAEPSAKMLRLARSLHAAHDIAWIQDSLPQLGKLHGPYDLIVASAVWMHIAPTDRERALVRLSALLEPRGRLYITLRLGPAEPERGLWKVGAGEVRELAARHELLVEDWGKRPDLLGREDVQWQTLLLTKTR